MPIVSVIIPVYNRKDKLFRAISSVMGQTFSDFEIIIVDDGSTEDGIERDLKQINGPIRYFAHPTNLGVSAARNTGIKYSDAPFIAFLDSDDHWLPKKLMVQLNFFEEHKQCFACQTDEIWIRNGCRMNPKKKHQKPSGDIFKESLKLCLVSPSAVMLRKTVFNEVGLFDESLPVCEDYDLWLRIACRYPIYLIPQLLIVKNGGHPDQLSVRYKGMDRFRIKALVKLIRSGVLNEQQFNCAITELDLKCRIYGNGCIKRNRIVEGKRYLSLKDKILSELVNR